MADRTRLSTVLIALDILLVSAVGTPANEPTARHWAYVPPARPSLPAVRSSGWSRNAIDRFVLARLEREGLAPSPEADPARLLRRVHLDLIGLPPSLAEFDAYLRDERPDAYQRVVDRLLSSPRFGERWARPWLDLARYADSNGFQRDGHRSIWPFRDWVIDAFNADMPFDRFTVEQIAGDLLPEPTLAQRIATGFHRCTPVNVEAGVDEEENRVLAVVDRVNTTATVWLGTTLECAQCHDHKYDAFTQKEYYRLFAFFNNTAIETRSEGAATRQFAGPHVELPQDPATCTRHEEIERALAAAKKELELTSAEGEAAGAAADDRRKHLQSRVKALTEDLEATRPATSLVMVENTPRTTHVLERGNFLTPADEVTAGTPSALHSYPSGAPRDRRGLAAWLVAPDNPLVARVVVNRLWEEIFARGLVKTSEDFGTQGSRPSHPLLLDWLAVELTTGGWSTKSVLRQIVNSATYRQSSRLTEEHRARDPGNRLLSRAPRFRFPAETVRDNALHVAGLLSLKMHGPPVYPEQPDGVWTVTGVVDNAYPTSRGEDRYRRGVYTVWRRSSPYPSFVNFDAPDRAAVCVRRPRTNTPLQALTLLNDPVYVRASCALAARVLRERGDAPTDEIAVHAFRTVLSREPSKLERRQLIETIERELALWRSNPKRSARFVQGWLPAGVVASYRVPAWRLAAWSVLSSLLLNLHETVTRG